MKTKHFFLILVIGILGVGLLGYTLIRIFLRDYTITSWWRTVSSNKEVGGVQNSMHLLGLAYDVSPKPTDEELDKLWWFRTKLTNYSNHVHLGWAG